ncbi:hypothetical protein [Cellulomonas sp. Marseille-Q8402]
MGREVQVGARVLAVLAALLVLGAGVAIGLALGGAASVGSGRWLSEWSRSAGFGGTAAIVAAAIAYGAASANARRQQWVDRKVQWWARAQWALDRVLSDDRHGQTAGLDVLAALASSEWAGEHESDVVDAALAGALGLRTAPSGSSGTGCPGSGDRRGTPGRSDSDEEVSR